ncbi:polysaccharide pyruvyl transferase family protein [Quadrisphaera granulorum]|nr:polysaccharide pyruvyl transferase family protein [Quadrisphaera granulorum]
MRKRARRGIDKARGRWRASRISSTTVRSAARRAGASAPGQSAGLGVHVLLAPPGDGNIGDQAMVEAFLERVDGPVVVVERNPGDIDLPARADVERISLPNLVFGAGPRRAADLATYSALLGRARSVSLIGADMLDGGYSAEGSVRRLLLAELAAVRGVPTRVLGFSWKPSPHPAALRALVEASRAGVVPMLRDPHSHERVVAHGVSGAVLTADLVFGALTSDDSLVEGLRAAVGRPRYAVVNASSLVARRGGQVEEYAAVLRHLLGEGLGVVLLPHVLRGTSDDLAACRAVAAVVPPDGVHLITERLAPAQVRGVAGAAEVVVTGRMHLAVMAAWGGVPPVTFATQGKVSGLMESLGTPELCVDPGPGSGARVVELLQAMPTSGAAQRISERLPVLRQRAALCTAGLQPNEEPAKPAGLVTGPSGALGASSDQ